MNDLINKKSFELLIHVANQKGIPEHLLTKDLPFTHADLLNQRGYVTWNEFATYCERFEKLIGGPQATLEVGKDLVNTKHFTSLIQFGGLFTSSKWFYQFLIDWFAPMLTPAIKKTSYRYLDPHTLEIHVASPPHLKPCHPVFRISASMLRYGPTLIGIQPSVVNLDIDENKAVFKIQIPPSMTLLSRTKRLIHTSLYGQNIINELAAQHQDLLQNFENLRRSETNFRHLINNSPDGIIIFIPEKIRFLNPAMMQFLNIENPNDIIGKPIDTVSQTLHDLVLTQTDPTHSQHSENLPFKTANEKNVWAEANTFQAHYNGESAFVSITRDITERKTMMTRAIEMDRMISMGVLAAGIGHEIKTPLSYLLANISYTQTAIEDLTKQIRDVTPNEDAKHEWLSELHEITEAMDAALNGAQRITEISQDLGSFSRNDGQQLEVILLQDPINAALNIARHEIRHRAGILTQIAVNPAILTSATKLSQIILNLLINAAHAIPSGDVDKNQITIKTHTDQQNAYITITDTGCGIPPDIIDLVFTPFFTTKPPGQGTGLGLSISKKLTEELGGSLTLTSQNANGTTALITLPLMQNPDTKQLIN